MILFVFFERDARAFMERRSVCSRCLNHWLMMMSERLLLTVDNILNKNYRAHSKLIFVCEL